MAVSDTALSDPETQQGGFTINASGVRGFLTSPDFIAKSPLEKAEERGRLLQDVVRDNPELNQLWASADNAGRQKIADQWRTKLQKDFPDSFKTEGFIYTQGKQSQGMVTPMMVDVPVLDSGTENAIAMMAPIEEVRDGKKFVTRNPKAEEFLAAIEDPVQRKQVSTLMRMRYGDLAPANAEIPDDLVVTPEARRIGGIYDYPVLIPNAVRMFGMVVGTTAGVIATAKTGPGVVVGGSIGGATGAAAVEPAAQYLEKEVFGTRKAYSAVDLLVNTAIGAFPAAPLKAAAPLARIGVRGVEGATAGGGIYTVQTALDPESEFSWKALAQHTGLGFAIGSGLGGAEAAWLANRLKVDAKTFQGKRPLQLVDELAKAKRISREEAAQLFKDSVDIGPQPVRQLTGPGKDLPGPTPEYPRTPMDATLERQADIQARSAAIEGEMSAADRLRQSPRSAAQLREELLAQQEAPSILQQIEAADYAPAEPFIRAANEQPGAMTGVAHRLGLSLTQPAELAALIEARARSVGRSASLTASGKYDDAAIEAAKGQYFQEAIDAALGQSGARRQILEDAPDTVFPFEGGTFRGKRAPATTPKSTESLALKDWAGNTKLVNTDGSPMVMYRGESTVNKDAPSSLIANKEAWFFTTDPVYAQEMAVRAARNSGGQPVVKSYHVKVESPNPRNASPDATGVSGEENLANQYDGWISPNLGKEKDEVVVFSRNQFREVPEAAAAQRVAAPDRRTTDIPIDDDEAIERAIAEQAKRRASGFSSKSGAIDPALLRYFGYAGARAATGAAIGYNQGETQEDKLGLMLAYSLAGAAMSPAGLRKVGRFAATSNKAGRIILPEVMIGKDLMRELQIGSGAKAALLHRQSRVIRRMTLGLRKLGPQAGTALEDVGKYMKGELNAAYLPQAVRGPAVEARIMIDNLSDRLVQSGIVQGELRNTIIQNMGSYLRRSFRVFIEEGWRPEQAVYDRFVTQAMMSGMTRQEANDLANGLLDRRTAERIFRGGSTAGKNLSSLMHRKDLDEATRALMGEITDPLDVFQESTNRLINLVETDAMQKRIVEVGTRLGVFKDASDTANGFTVQLAKEGSEAYDNFVGVWMQPEFRQALERRISPKDVGPIWRSLVSVNSTAKATKTLLNPESYAPNAIGSALGVIQNGHLNPVNFVRGLGKGVVAVGDEIPFVRRIGENLIVDKKAMEREVEEMIRLGVFGESVEGGDILRSINESFATKLGRVKDYVLVPFSKVYQGTDNTGKLIAYFGEMQDYGWALPNLSQAELKQLAAGRVRATTQTYGEIPQIVKSASVVGLAPSFVNFTWEVFRNSHNIVKIANDDIRQGFATKNPRLVAIGAKRLSSFLTVLGIGAAAATLSRDQSGISEDEEMAIRRQIVPEWDQNSMLVWDSWDGKSVSYTNQSYVFPPSIVMEGAAAAMRGDNPQEAWDGFRDAFAEQFVQGSILLAPAAEAVVGRTMDTGREIVRPEATNLESAMDRSGYLGDKAFMPLIIPHTQKFLMALREEKGLYGETYEVNDRLKRLFGMRVNKMEVDTRLARNARQLSTRLNEQTAFFNASRRLNLKPEELESRYQDSEVSRQRIFDSATQFVSDAKTLGVDEGRIIKYFRDGGMSSSFILGVLDGAYVAGKKESERTSADLWDEIADLPEKERMDAIGQTKDKGMRDSLRQRNREMLRGLTAKDKLIGNLDPEERASYMNGVLSGLMSQQARDKQMDEWAKARLLNPETRRFLGSGGRN